MTKKRAEILISGVWIVISILLLYTTRNAQLGMLYPRVLLIGIMILSALIILANPIKRFFLKENNSEGENTDEKIDFISVDVVVMVVSLFIYVALWSLIGFVLSSIVFMFVLYAYKKVPLRKSVIVSIAGALAVQFIFGYMFQVPLPQSGFLIWF